MPENNENRGGPLAVWSRGGNGDRGLLPVVVEGDRVAGGPHGPDPTGRHAGRGQRRLPEIDVIHQQLRHITEEALEAIALANDPPRIFRRAGVMVRLTVEENTNKVVLQPLVGKVLRNLLARVANWFRNGVPIPPPNAVVHDVEATADWWDVPDLEMVVLSPAVTSSGELITRSGYHPQARTWYQPDPDLGTPEVPSSPSEADVRRAREFIESNLFVDFPFAEECDRAVAWAALILPVIRPLVQGPTPLHLFVAPSPGTGKTLLGQCIMVPALGRKELEVMTVDCEEQEMRKRITGSLRNAPTAIMMDNLGQGRRLESSSLASVLTATAWQDRILGSSLMMSQPVRCVWLATGNNPLLSDELARRTVRCRLDTGKARPHMRRGFRHADLLAWAHANRSPLLGAILTLVRAWLVSGRPAGDLRLGMYESWCRVVGGILQAAGVGGLRRAIELLQGAETDLEKAIAPFIRSWWERHESREVGVKDLYDVADTAGCLEAVLDAHLTNQQRQRARGTETERARQTRLGQALKRLSGQVYAGYQIQAAGSDRCARQLYRLSVEAAETPS